MYKVQSIHPKNPKKKLHMKAINYACSKPVEKVTRSARKNKKNFMKVI